MRLLLALLAKLRPFAGPVLAFAGRHWRALSVAVLVIVAALAMRGCARERSRAEGAEAQASAERAQLQAQFDGALQTVRGLSAALSQRVDAAQKQGATPVAVFSGSSGRQTVSPLPAAPDSAIGPPAAGAGTSLAEGPGTQAGGGGQGSALPPLCVLAVGDGFEMKLTGAELKKRDGGHLLVAECALERDDGYRLSGIVEAPVTLPPVDLGPVPPPLDVAKGWGWGAFGTASAAGWAAGAAVALPPLRFHLLGPREVAAQLGAGGGSAGFVSMASVIVR